MAMENGVLFYVIVMSVIVVIVVMALMRYVMVVSYSAIHKATGSLVTGRSQKYRWQE